MKEKENRPDSMGQTADGHIDSSDIIITYELYSKQWRTKEWFLDPHYTVRVRFEGRIFPINRNFQTWEEAYEAGEERIRESVRRKRESKENLELARAWIAAQKGGQR